MVAPADDPAADAGHILIRISGKTKQKQKQKQTQKQQIFDFDYKLDEMWMISSKTQALVVLLSIQHIKMGISGPAARTWFDWQKNQKHFSAKHKLPKA